jgi:hypothetical protein
MQKEEPFEVPLFIAQLQLDAASEETSSFWS